MFGTIASTILGATAFSIYRSNWSGLAPGACIGWYIWFAFAGAQSGQSLPAHWVAGPVGMGLLYLLGRVRVIREKRLVEIPTDARILTATSIAFLLRGSWLSDWVIWVLVAFDVLLFGFICVIKLPKPPKSWEEEACRMAMAPPME